MLPHNVTNSEQFASLSAYAVKLLVDMLNQYHGKQNGDLSAAWTLMEKHGWSGNSTLRKALLELERKGFIVKTRQGGRHKASLYAVTWLGIDECNGKHDHVVSPVPLNYWKEGGNPEIANPAPPHGAMYPVRRCSKDKAA